ncbi:OmpA family protein [Puia dinghuensis]|uniref:Flagellar motor protein MotB n=1 Tax=Puia dinghuensis TaxID=1792502 RepID=A0A8J2UFN1_9BACT|nr:OmpA family protein [Puia dinghuensis]GGB11136.1 flagellar motor protein MotB [Puia dinghuensis]
MKLKHTLLFTALSVFLFSCVSSKKFKAAQAKIDSLTAANAKLASDLKNCTDLTGQDSSQKAALQNQIDALNKQIDFLKQNHDATLKQLQDLSVISNSQAESIKKSLENIGAKDSYIQNLQAELAHKDSLNMALVMNLKGAIGNMDDKDINIKVDKGVVYIDISDKMLFKSGSFEVTKGAEEVLGKVAQVLKAQPDIEFMVEGHTDNKNYARPPYMLDNWDLSVKRATSVVRILQKKYGLDPAHITAAGRSEYVPLAGNDNEEGRAANRRTRIVILPQLDQFFKLLEKK